MFGLAYSVLGQFTVFWTVDNGLASLQFLDKFTVFPASLQFSGPVQCSGQMYGVLPSLQCFGEFTVLWLVRRQDHNSPARRQQCQDDPALFSKTFDITTLIKKIQEFRSLLSLWFNIDFQ